MPKESSIQGASLMDALRGEYAAVRPDSGYSAVADSELFPAVHGEKTPLAALCISGGGIRSATFALGALQGLAEKGILTGFDYLSTVSGGGYIGSWLTSWKHRRQGLNQVTPYLRRDAPPIPDGEPDPIQHLREYNSYLAPKTGFMSADAWTLAATVIRNMFLNWTVLLPLLMAALLAPRLLLSIGRLGETYDRFYSNSLFPPPRDIATFIPIVCWALLAITVFYFMKYLPGVGGENHTQVEYLVCVLLPGTLAALAFVANDSWLDDDSATPYLPVVGGFTLACFAGWLAFMALYPKKVKPKRIFPVTCSVLLAGCSGGTAAWYVAKFIYSDPRINWAVYTTIAAPLILLAMLLSGSLFVGFTSEILADDAREWLSRAGAWFGVFVTAWMGMCALSLLAPTWLMGLPTVLDPLFGCVGVAAGWVTALAGLSAKTAARKSTAGPPPKSLAMRLAGALAAPVFAVALLTVLGIATDGVLKVSGLGASSNLGVNLDAEQISPCPNCAWWNHEAMLEGTRFEAVAALGLAFLLVAWLMARYININKFSLHSMYRNRLIRAYTGASNLRDDVSKFTGFAESDNILMRDLDPRMKPFHVLNVTLNLVSGERLAWQQRKAESFTISPLHCGCANPDLGYVPSAKYGGPDGISLGTAMAISGAAASPNMGYHSSPVIAFIMTLFNARLGAWLGNPGPNGVKAWRDPGPRSAVKSLVREAFGLTNETNRYVYLSDGGHFENLGLYEMVRRRCHYIVVLDGGCDPDFTFDDLGNALRKIRIDMKIPIDFESSSFEPLRKAERRCAIASIGYSQVDSGGRDGWLLYIKPMIRGNEPPDVSSYQCHNPSFPHQSTSDQFFDESQTESYRVLGLHTISEICEGWDQKNGFEGLIPHLSEVYCSGVKAAAASGSGM